MWSAHVGPRRCDPPGSQAWCASRLPSWPPAKAAPDPRPGTRTCTWSALVDPSQGTPVQREAVMLTSMDLTTAQRSIKCDEAPIRILCGPPRQRHHGPLHSGGEGHMQEMQQHCAVHCSGVADPGTKPYTITLYSIHSTPPRTAGSPALPPRLQRQLNPQGPPSGQLRRLS